MPDSSRQPRYSHMPRARTGVPGSAPNLRDLPDTGIRLRRRAERQRKRAAANRRLAATLMIALTLAVVGVAVLAKQAEPGTADGLPFLRRSDLPANRTVMRPARPEIQPTPLFASHKGIKLRLPVAVDELTEVGFHQASYDYALPLSTPLPDASLSKAKKRKGTGRDISKQEAGEDAVLTGKVLRMWRTRPGKPNTAVDVGAKPGSVVFAPVTGTVVLVKKYKLYDRYTDFQIHIIPDGRTSVDCVLIHIDRPLVKAGDRVFAGLTHMAEVRRFSDKMNMQLGHYTKGGGDHVHVQLNDVKHPEYEGLKGAIRMSELP